MNETTICGNCGAPIWADARGARHKCKPRNMAARIAEATDIRHRVAAALAAAFGTFLLAWGFWITCPHVAGDAYELPIGRLACGLLVVACGAADLVVAAWTAGRPR